MAIHPPNPSPFGEGGRRPGEGATIALPLPFLTVDHTLLALGHPHPNPLPGGEGVGVLWDVVKPPIYSTRWSMGGSERR